MNNPPPVPNKGQTRHTLDPHACALTWSALRGSARCQKVLWVGRKDVRRRADFCGARYEQCTGYGKPGVRFSRQADPLQIETAKIHAPPGILPWNPQDLVRPFAPTGEAASDAQKPPPQVPTDSRRRGRPKGVT